VPRGVAPRLRLPSSLLGPVLLSAFLRLASICRNEVIGRRILAPGGFIAAILGASGSGKSLRAGVLPRLARDDRQFLALPIIRPERQAARSITMSARSRTRQIDDVVVNFLIFSQNFHKLNSKRRKRRGAP
jgi:hypothetical protein